MCLFENKEYIRARYATAKMKKMSNFKHIFVCIYVCDVGFMVFFFSYLFFIIITIFCFWYFKFGVFPFILNLRRLVANFLFDYDDNDDDGINTVSQSIQNTDKTCLHIQCKPYYAFVFPLFGRATPF